MVAVLFKHLHFSLSVRLNI